MSSFANLGVRSDVVTRLNARGITEPFPIQAATIADALAGRDVCGRAPTGSGKTIAFGIPLVTSVDGKAAPRQPRGLVLVPTRELANQVAEELQHLAGPKGRIATVYGGVGYGDQLRALRRGVDILVACPGRLKDLVDRNEVRLNDVSFIVLDEADRMADMGFLPEVRRLLDQVRDDRQTLLFSATLDGDINTLIQRYQNDPVRHEVESDEDSPQNTHLFWKTHVNERVALTAGIVTAQWPAIVFTRTKHGADRLTTQLEAAGVKAVAIHGDKSQAQRERSLRSFTGGKVQCLVATDVAARGIHVDNVACVVHFDPPADDKDYIHRSGRTGRAGEAGIVVTLAMHNQVKLVAARAKRLELNPNVVPADLDALRGGTTFVAAPEAPRAERPARGPRPERGPRPDRPRRDDRFQSRDERPRRDERTDRSERPNKPTRAGAPAKPVRQRKPQVQIEWGAERPKGTGHPRKAGTTPKPKHHRKGTSAPRAGAPGRVGGVRRNSR